VIFKNITKNATFGLDSAVEGIFIFIYLF